MSGKPTYEELERKLEQYKHDSVRFACIFKAIPDAVVFSDANRQIMMANPAASQIFGYTEEEVLGANTQQFYASGEEYEKQGEVRFNLTAEEKLKPYEARYRRKNGEIFHSETVGTVVRDDEGNTMGFLAIIKDITERVKARKALQEAYHALERRVELGTDELREAQEKKQKYLDIAGVMLIALNAAGEITLINQHGCCLLQVKEEEVLGRNWFDQFVPTRMADSVKKVFSQLMSGDVEPVKYYENPVLTSSGEERIISFHNTILTDGEGRINGILFSGDDITEHKQIEEELQRRSQKLEEANIALRILLKQCGDARQELEKNVLANINELITPHLENLDMKLTDKQQKAYVDIIKSNLRQITASFSRNLYEQFPGLTPREIQVVDFIKNGMTNKDIAELLGLSSRTVETYRDNIRIKLGIKNKQVNLRSHILSLR
ncbi:MAG: PAS domain S-box protein [Proteobacteria bacterium]|nr:PAS domain S-box protein [Pseudomonadota bacterium]MBU4297378.1 PAS domain S-box protein [Pseudomonadota bacterium]MCG2747022.1 PAS domain S-box protein [Desulfobulbaceae bacterium]